MADHDSQYVTVTHASHHSTLVDKLWQFFRTKHRVDMCVLGGGQLLHTHQLLADVFLSPDKLIETAPYAESGTLDSLFEFLYKGSVRVRRENLNSLLQVAQRSEFGMLVDAVESAKSGAQPQLSEVVDDRSSVSHEATPVAKSNAPAYTLLTEVKRGLWERHLHPKSTGSAVVDSITSHATDGRRSIGVTVKNIDESQGCSLTGVQSQSTNLSSETNVNAGSSFKDNRSYMRKELQYDLNDDISDDDNYDSAASDEGSSRFDSVSEVDHERPASIPLPRVSRLNVTTPKSLVNKCRYNTKSKKSAERPHKCDQCSWTFSSVGNLRRHSRTHAAEGGAEKQQASTAGSETAVNLPTDTGTTRQFQCDACPLAFKHLSSLTLHRLSHESVADIIDQHSQAQVVDRPFSCDTCGKTYTSANHLATHLTTHSKERTFICQICSKAFRTAYNLRDHVRTHSNQRSHVCSVCNKAFAKRSNLQAHSILHSSNRPHDRIKSFKCEVCERAFADRHTLLAHGRIHTGEKPFSCHICQRPFAHRSALTIHIRTHTGERPYKCQYCPKAFFNGGALRAHVRTHTGEKPHKCDQCPKAFSYRESLVSHLRTHTGERPFQCTICPKAFSNRDSLKGHTRSHSREKSFKCDKCPQTFTCRTALSAHSRTHSEPEICGVVEPMTYEECVPDLKTPMQSKTSGIIPHPSHFWREQPRQSTAQIPYTFGNAGHSFLPL